MADVLKKFGRYLLLDQIAQGGMAEIYRARPATVDGAGRIIVIKRIQAGYGQNNEFVQMFKSEIEVTMGFNHPNIVQLYDYGEEQGQPYISMELVDGRNLRQFLSRFSELKQHFPVELAAYVVEQAASGLHYAHMFKNKATGEPLNIVHRDISPQNILISYDGNVKVIDFGIAKASTNSESTRAGVIKGKPSYLSPEQISGEQLDGRCDQFALGIVLWELLTGKKLFAGENDLAVLKLIESCSSYVKPPSTLNPKVPKELDYIVLKTLAKPRDKRYGNCEELQRALHRFLYAYSPDFNPNDLAYHAKDLFKAEIVEDRKKLNKLTEKAAQLISSNIAEIAAPVVAPPGVQKEDTTAVVKRPSSISEGAMIDITLQQRGHVVDLERAPTPRSGTVVRGGQTKGQPDTSRSRGSQNAVGFGTRSRTVKKNSGMPLAITVAAGLVAVLLFGPEMGVQIPFVTDAIQDLIGTSVSRLELKGNYKAVTVMINNQVVAKNIPATLKGIPVGTPVRLNVIGAEGKFEKDITLRKGESKVVDVQLAPEGVAAVPPPDQASPDNRTILLRLNITPGGARTIASINGRRVSTQNPVIAVPLDAPLELTAEHPGYKLKKLEFVVASNQVNGLKEWPLEVPMEPEKFGFLTIRSTPSADVKITVNGDTWKRKTPIENEKVPVGSYRIHLDNNVLGMSKTVPAYVDEGKSVTIDERLEIK